MFDAVCRYLRFLMGAWGMFGSGTVWRKIIVREECMSIRVRLYASVGTLLVSLVLVGAVGLYKVNSVHETATTVAEDHLPSVVALQGVDQAFSRLRLHESQYVGDKNPEWRKWLDEQMAYQDKMLQYHLAALEKHPQGDAGKTLLADLKKQLADYTATHKKVLETANGGDWVAAATLAQSDSMKQSRQVTDTLAATLKAHLEAARSAQVAAQQEYSNTRIWFVAVTLVGVLIAAFIAYWLAHSITMPLEAMRKTVDEIVSSKNLSRRVPVQWGDEIGQTVSAFNMLLDSLQASFKHIWDDACHVAQSAGEVASTAHQVAQSSTHQSESANAMAAAVEQVTASINHVSDSAQEAHRISNQSGTLAAEGNEVIQRAVAEIRQIADSVKSASVSVVELGRRSGEISQVVQVIKEVADQTNLLALNAAIEAARAGEQGRGFAVVADEVRKLAERSASSAQEIAGMIAGIQTGTDEAVNGMGAAVARVESGVELANHAGVSITRISEGSQRVVKVVGDISAAIREQGVASNQLARHVESIASNSEENNAASANAAAHARELDRMASSLRDTVGQFRI
jgi:methyl-accepting chemotaxis protein